MEYIIKRHLTIVSQYRNVMDFIIKSHLTIVPKYRNVMEYITNRHLTIVSKYRNVTEYITKRLITIVSKCDYRTSSFKQSTKNIDMFLQFITVSESLCTLIYVEF